MGAARRWASRQRRSTFSRSRRPQSSWPRQDPSRPGSLDPHEQRLQDLEQGVERAINDVRYRLLDPKLRGERRRALEEELFSSRCSRAGVFTKHWRHYLGRHGIHGGKRPVLQWPGGAILQVR